MKHVLVEPRAYGVQTMRYDVDHIGNVRGVYTQILEETPEGMVVVDGTERHWPADLVLLSIEAPKVPNLQYQDLLILLPNKIKSSPTIKIIALIKKNICRWGCERGQSLVVWAIKEGRAVAQSVDKFLKQKVFV